MLPKSCSMFMLIVAIQFSQIFAAPRDGVLQDQNIDQAGINVMSPLPSTNDDIKSPEQNLENLTPSIVASAVEDGISAQLESNPMETLNDSIQPVREQVEETAENSMLAAAPSVGEPAIENIENSMQTATDQAESVNPEPLLDDEETAPTGNDDDHYSHMLTREQELNILHKVPEFSEIIQALENLPDHIYNDMKSFLDRTVPKMPDNNLFTRHFKNAQVLIHMFERLVKVAKNGGAHKPSSRKFFRRVHKAAPEMKAEMDHFNGFIQNTQSRLASLGTSTNPMADMAPSPTDGINVSTGSISLPLEQKEDSASEFTSEKSDE